MAKAASLDKKVDDLLAAAEKQQPEGDTRALTAADLPAFVKRFLDGVAKLLSSPVFLELLKRWIAEKEGRRVE